MFRSLLLVFVLLATPALADDNEKVAAELTKLFQSGPVETGSAAVDAAIEDVKAYYATRANKPVWVRDDGPKGKAKALLEELRSSTVHGLSPETYNASEIAYLMGSRDPADLARLDMLLSGAVVEFGRDLRNGRIEPGNAGAENAVTPVSLDTAKYIEGAADAGNFREYAAGFINADERYVRLIAKLSEFERMIAGKMWPAIAADGAPIAKGASDPRIAQIRTLLVLSGDLEPSHIKGGMVLDEPVSAAISRFQERYELPQTGAIDKATLAEMAVPPQARTRQIRLNLERRRWQNRDLEPSHLYVNLAEPVARIVRDGETTAFLGIANLAELGSVPTFFGTVESATDEAGKTVLQVRPKAGETVGMADAPVRIVLDGKAEIAPGLQVFLTYITAWVGSDGQLHFGRDVFGRDPVLAGLMGLGE